MVVNFCRIVADGVIQHRFTDTWHCCFRNVLGIYHLKVEPAVGIEPTTDGLQNRCSTTELRWRGRNRASSTGFSQGLRPTTVGTL